MTRAVVLLSVGLSFVAGCGGGSSPSAIDATANGSDSGVDAPTAQVCLDAEAHSDLTWIQDNIFSKQCTFSGCHNGATGDAGKMDLRSGHTIASIVGVDAHLCAGTNIVTAGDPMSSYMMVMLGQFAPTAQVPPECAIDPTIGEMPQGNPTVLLCSQKRDAIQRWITAGAPDN